MTIAQHWTERVRAGDFSAIPVPFTWEQSAEFSHLIDAYELTGSVEACLTILDRVLEEIRFTGHSTASPLDIWITFFSSTAAASMQAISQTGPGARFSTCFASGCASSS